MQKKQRPRPQLVYELDAMGRYLHNGMVSGTCLGLSYLETYDEIEDMVSWLLASNQEFLQDRLLLMLGMNAKKIKIDKALKAFTPLANTLLFKVPKPDPLLLPGRKTLIRTIPLVIVVLLYGFLRATGRITDNETMSRRGVKSDIFMYKLPNGIKENLGGVSCLYQGLAAGDLPKLMFISVNGSPFSLKDKITKRGFPPTVLYLLHKYKELHRRDLI